MSGSTRMRLTFVDLIGPAVTFHNAAFRIANEIDDSIAFFGYRHLAFKFFQRLAVVHPLHENVTVDLLDFADLFRSKSTATKSYRVDTCIGEGFTCCLHVWRYVFTNERASRDHDVGADLHELVECACPTDYGPVVNFNVACELNCVNKYAIVTDDAVVSDVDICHQEAVLANHGFVLVARSAAHRDVLADDGIVADKRFRFFSGKLQILWYR